MASSEALAAVAPYASSLTRDVESVARDLESYADLLRKWQRIQNLVSRETLTELWTRHMADSLQTLSRITEKDSNFIDLGSGGGFPAIPLATALKGRAHYLLVEPTQRKVSFLRTVARELGLDAKVDSRRIEQIDPRETFVPDVITSRALANLETLCGMMLPFFGPNTRAILHKGREHVEEIEQASTRFAFNVLVTRSDTDPNGVLLELSNLSRKDR
ncbi:ribosomal RNA small subunit methyltransferase G [Youhaiella tibetensis]|uniref:Ribosomal RNA small subunit methyltransferase G n=1 Tax=Paradevosia tibetensis TaxID=1447062 RepID=A0A5B9DU91_9HYPH|nr:16S rRNA (guanine(527)-N(7))-methyltransferase RsmG [Youhaiella tibetensis]QEE22495.1 16S rRNA (guanine(527)-N(7))-methyltransferase RsmG [Youhaiella tibetensis]GGF41788.1 ribosomal RNA small subunit methyltransferase G [Youhaiella tibetensis]